MLYKIQSFNDFLEDRFMELDEIGGRAITKDNFEDMAENWFSQLDVDELIKYGDEYGKLVAKETVYNIVDELQKKVN